ncbi:hypothetical protein [Actinoplanes regularis]|uniref:hypothetical protein n=1 Tax=Actinoplanes regularis TaxID=52697 RepID=UPI00255570F3|nr:hypothetical protein [Actinoplanes regularis]GLW27639.1 hypothetical protein Areg01_05800 [Actinoplanes regularis]
MTDVDPAKKPRLTDLLFYMLAFLLGAFGLMFVRRYIPFLVASLFISDMLGQVGVRPAAFAALIALVALPMNIAYWLPSAWPGIRSVFNGTDLPGSPVRARWQRLGDELVRTLLGVSAALIVFEGIADPRVAPTAPILAVVILGPIALSQLTTKLIDLLKRGWRRWTSRGYQPRHLAPAEPAQSGDQVST